MLKNQINVPFSGYYESEYSRLLDNITELDEDTIAINHGYDYQIHGNVNDFITKNNIDIYTEQSEHEEKLNYPKMKEVINKIYVEEYIEQFNNETNLNLSFMYKDMESPKYYNFSTDRLFATISEQDKEKLYNFARDNISAFRRVLLEHCNSYDGFISSYSNDVNEWLGKPFSDYDHNELNILLYVAIDVCNVNIDDFNNSIYEAVHERAISNGNVQCSYIGE